MTLNTASAISPLLSPSTNHEVITKGRVLGHLELGAEVSFAVRDSGRNLDRIEGDDDFLFAAKALATHLDDRHPYVADPSVARSHQQWAGRGLPVALGPLAGASLLPVRRLASTSRSLARSAQPEAIVEHTLLPVK